MLAGALSSTASLVGRAMLVLIYCPQAPQDRTTILLFRVSAASSFKSSAHAARDVHGPRPCWPQLSLASVLCTVSCHLVLFPMFFPSFLLLPCLLWLLLVTILCLLQGCHRCKSAGRSTARTKVLGSGTSSSGYHASVLAFILQVRFACFLLFVSIMSL